LVAVFKMLQVRIILKNETPAITPPHLPTPMSDQLVLAVLPGSTERDRLLLVMSETPGAALALVQQSWSETTGWFNQTSIELTAEQVGMLRASLGRGVAGRTGACVATWPMPARPSAARSAQKTGAAEATPAIISLSDYRRAESA